MSEGEKEEFLNLAIRLLDLQRRFRLRPVRQHNDYMAKAANDVSFIMSWGEGEVTVAVCK